jgi:exopolysaccharide biosynthesis polyprenyl glycosylphosphotransferase
MLLLLGDTLVVNGAVLAAFYLWTVVGGRVYTAGFVLSQWTWFPILTGLWWLVAHLWDLYDMTIADRRLDVTQRVGAAGLSLLIVYLVFYFLLPRDALPRLFALFFVGVAFAGIFVWRCAYVAIFSLPHFRRRVLIVGAGQAGRKIARVLSDLHETGYRAIGFIDDDPAKQGSVIAGLPVMGSSEDLIAQVLVEHVDTVVVAISKHMQGEMFQRLMDCTAAGVDVVRMPVLYERLTRRVPVEHIEQGWVLESLDSANAWTRLARGIKWLLDMVVGMLGGLVFGALLPFLALAIKLDSPGPVFYRQVRLGRGCRPFYVYKLRTMVPDAEQDGGARWATENDSRITRVGKFLRKTRLDELPQTINVLRGEMSVVGPRPERPEFSSELEAEVPFYRARLCVKPGLTGWAQVRYRYGNSIEDMLIKVQYDFYYVRHWSLWLDLYVIFKTVGVVLRGGGT